MVKNEPEKAFKIADTIIKNTYRTLMTRGQKGCYIFCMDKGLSNYLKMNTVGFSTVTNHATGVCENKLSHQEVIEVGKVASEKLSKLIKNMIKEI